MYIRTKDGVYEVEQSQLEDDEEVVNCDCGQIGKLEIKRKSENLDELCDEFVIEYADGSKIISIHDNIDDFLREHKDEIESGYIKNVYGAVWCEWGLKYVAKLDDKGELHLL